MQNRKKYSTFFGIWLLAFIVPAYAINFTPVVSIGAGASMASDVGKSQSFPIVDPTTDEFYDYSASGATKTEMVYDAFLGAEWPLNANWSIQGGLDYTQLGHAYSATGSYTQGVDVPSSDQYNYQYQVNSKEVFAETKLFYNFKKRYHPYVLLGLGEAFNNATNYSTTAPEFLTFTRQYQDHMNHSFAYTLGVGADVDITSKIRLGIGYRFNNAGTINLGSASIDSQSVSGTLKQSSFYMNQVLAQLTYAIR